MQVIPFAANFEVAASVRCSPKIISLGNFTHTVCYAFYWFAFFLNFFCYFVRTFFFGWTRLDWTGQFRQRGTGHQLAEDLACFLPGCCCGKCLGITGILIFLAHRRALSNILL